MEAGADVVYCQVVSTRGSTPQKAGSGMLLLPDGSQVGTLGGGCVEAEVAKQAAGRIGHQGGVLHSFVLNHDYAWADGLICGGKMVILADAPRGQVQLDYYRLLHRAVASGTGFTEAAVLNPEKCGAKEIGERFLFDLDGNLMASLLGGLPATEVTRGLPALDARPRPSEKSGVAYLPSAPRIRLLIVGCGHVGQAVAELASKVDFEVWVVDDRREYASRERFPWAQKIIVGPLGQALPSIEINDRTYALIVTRGHGHDQEALGLLAPTVAPYVGLIGSKRKISMIFDALIESGASEEDLSRVSAPVGLDIGSESVDEIAVSIVAELIARRNRGLDGARSLRCATEWARA